MPPGMESIVVGVLAHLRQSVVKPHFVRSTEDRAQLLVKTSSLKERDVSADILLANDISESGYRAHRAQNGTVIITRQRYFLLPLPILNSFGEAEVEDNALDAVVIEVLHVTPAYETFRIDLREGSWDEA